MLLDRIKKELKQAMLDQDEDKKDALRIVLGEVPRLNKKANEKVTDQEIETIIRKLIKSETEMISARAKNPLYTKNSLMHSNLFSNVYINILKEYVPTLMSEDEIRQWISDIITIDELMKNQAMGFIMKNLKGKVDGSLVKKIVDNIWDS